MGWPNTITNVVGTSQGFFSCDRLTIYLWHLSRTQQKENIYTCPSHQVPDFSQAPGLFDPPHTFWTHGRVCGPRVLNQIFNMGFLYWGAYLLSRPNWSVRSESTPLTDRAGVSRILLIGSDIKPTCCPLLQDEINLKRHHHLLIGIEKVAKNRLGKKGVSTDCGNQVIKANWSVDDSVRKSNMITFVFNFFLKKRKRIKRISVRQGGKGESRYKNGAERVPSPFLSWMP